MNSLEKKIQQIESEITLENSSIDYQRALLKDQVDLEKSIPFLATGGFLLGYFIGSKRIISKFFFVGTVVTFLVKRIYKSLKLLLFILH